jgi:hypothetical protein
MTACDFRAIYDSNDNFVTVGDRDSLKQLGNPDLRMSETPLSMEEIKQQLEQTCIEFKIYEFADQYDAQNNYSHSAFYDSAKILDRERAINKESERLKEEQINGNLSLPISDQAIAYYTTKGELIREKLKDAGYDNIGYKQDIDAIPPELFMVSKDDIIAALEAKYVDKEAGERFSIKTKIPSNRVEPDGVEHSRSTGLQVTGHGL